MNGINGHRRRTNLPWILAFVVTLVVGVFVTWLIVRTPDDPGTVASLASTTTTASVAVPVTLAPASTTEPAVTTATTAATTTTTTANTETSSAPPITEPLTSTTTTTVAPETTTVVTPPATDADPSTTLLFTQNTTVNPTSGLSYPTLSDGRPVPILLVFDRDTIRLSGSIPAEATRQWIIDIALSNVPEGEPVPTVIDELIVNPDVPVRTGVRVVETDSGRFAIGSAEVSPEQAAEYDRFIPVLDQLDYLDVLIIGHADEGADSEADFVLAAERAKSVNDYIVSNGIPSERVTWRGASEEDALSGGDESVARTLARRVEIVYYGLLIQQLEQ